MVCIGLLLPIDALGKVHGVCSNCHTMHNSENGGNVHTGGPLGNLLKTDCVGCHSSTAADTIKVIGAVGGSSRVPIVYNTVEPTYPTASTASGSDNTLAGGNFYWVEHVGDQYGHNVISHADSILTEAPGRKQGCANSCHYNLYTWSAPWAGTTGGGCTSCHTPAHHKGGTNTAITDAEDGWYRFLAKKHSNNSDDHSIKGFEDSDWQQTVSSTDHNEYWDEFDGSSGVYGISRFCAACHGLFHSTLYGQWSENGGFKPGPGGGWYTAPWFRHPAGIYLPDTGETSKYNTDGSGPDGVTGPYNPIAPVSRQNIDSITSPSQLVVVGSSGDMISCVSCHRAHGSPYPDMLRWDYLNTCEAKQPNASCGCLICHTAKD